MSGGRPLYRSLPDGRAVGVYDSEEQRGCLNALTPERTQAAAGLIRTGETFGLNAPLDYPYPHPHVRRTAPTHVVIRYPERRDEYFDGLYPQSGSQWDGFLHFRDMEHDCFYNGNTDESRGIEAWAARGIAGHGVLLDVARFREAQGRAIDWSASDVVTVDDLVECADAEGVAIGEGTILIVRFGWETGWTAATVAERLAVIRPVFNSPGLEPSLAMVEHLWDWGLAAVAADNFGLEPMPMGDYVMHVDLLPRLGMPIGEFWHVDELAAVCAREGRYEFFLTSAPLHVRGGIGSTANALAIL